MKRFTALALAVVMTLLAVSSAIPVFAVDVAKAEDLQEAMKKGEDVTLTGDVNLSAIEWETISEYAGTLDGKGYTITVPSDTTFIDKLSGTVKNLNLTGNTILGNEDVSKTRCNRDVLGYGLGVLANWAWGATVDGVNSDVNVYFSQSTDKIVNYGGLIGNTLADYELSYKNAATFEYDITFNEFTTIKNCSVGGSAYLLFGNPQKNAVAGIVGTLGGLCTIDNCAVRTNMYVTNSAGQNGGIAGSIRGDIYRFDNNAKEIMPNVDLNDSGKVDGTDRDMYYNALLATKDLDSVVATISNCLYDGNFEFAVHGIDQIAAITGYGIGADIKNCYVAGTLRISGGTARHIFSYSNVGNYEANIVDITGCASTANVYVGTSEKFELAYVRNAGTIADMILGSGQVNNVKGTTNTNGLVGEGTDEEVINAFVNKNSDAFAIDNGVVKLKRETNIVAGTSYNDTAIWSDEDVLVKNAEDFAKINHNTKKIVIENDINLNEAWGAKRIFNAKVYGNGHTVTVNGGNGLFQHIENVEVHDLSVAGVITSTTAYAVNVGAVASWAKNVGLYNVNNMADITVKITNKKGGYIGGLLGKAEGEFNMDTCANLGDLSIDSTHHKGTTTYDTKEKKWVDTHEFANPDVGGIIGRLDFVNSTDPVWEMTRVANYGDVTYGITKPMGGNVGGIAGRILSNGGTETADNMIVEQCLNRGAITGKLCSERAGGLFGYYRDVNIDCCYNTGKVLFENWGYTNTANPDGENNTGDEARVYKKLNDTARGYGLVGYSNTGSHSSSVVNSYAFVNGGKVDAAYGTGNGSNSILKNNYYENGIKETSHSSLKSANHSDCASYTDASDLLAKLEANQATAGVFVADDCNINYGYPIFAWEAHEYVTLYEENEKNYVTTGKDLDCDKYNNAEFAGFVQFANDSNKVRFIMAIDADYLAEASTKYESFDVVITVNGDKTATVNSLTLSSYKEVTAGTDVYYADECEIFGFIMNFGDTVVSSLDFKIVIGEETFELGSYTAN